MPTVIPAYSYFSIVSQDAANTLALEQGCSTEIDWTQLVWGPCDVNPGPGTAAGMSFEDTVNMFVSRPAVFGNDTYSSCAGTMTYSGAEAQCILVYEKTVTGNPSITGDLVITVDAVPVYNVTDTAFDQESGAKFMLPFTVPVSVSAAIDVSILLRGGSNGFISGTGTVNAKILASRYTTNSAEIIVPALLATITVEGYDLSWLEVGETFYVQSDPSFVALGGIGYFQVVTVVSPAEVTAQYVQRVGPDVTGLSIPADGANITEFGTNEV